MVVLPVPSPLMKSPHVRWSYSGTSKDCPGLHSAKPRDASANPLMLILFDQGTPMGIRECLQGHTIRTAYQQGWSTLLNGELLKAAEDAGFDLLLTTDKNLVYQQNLKNKWSLIQPMLQQISDAVNAAKPGSYTLVGIPNQ